MATPKPVKLVLNPDMLGGGKEKQTIRGNYYRRNFRRMIVINFVLMAVVIGLMSYIAFTHLTPNNPNYYATLTDGRLVPLKPTAYTKNVLESYQAKNATQMPAAP